MKSCKQCGAPLSDPFECLDCGWSSKNAPRKEAQPKTCFACHMLIEDGQYYRVWYHRKEQAERYKCDKCLVYADLDWCDKLIHDWFEAHPEFKFKPETEQDQHELQAMCMAYIRKITKGGTTRKLPYDKNTFHAPDEQRSEEELLNQLPKAESLFEDLHNKQVCP